MLSQLIYLRANLEGFSVQPISSIWKVPKVWFQQHMHRKSSKVQNRQPPIYQKWHQAMDFLSLASLDFWDIIGSDLKEKLCLSVHKCDAYVFIHWKQNKRKQNKYPDVCTHDTCICCQEQNIVIIKWKLFHFLKARLGPNMLVHIWNCNSIFHLGENIQHWSTILFPINIPSGM